MVFVQKGYFWPSLGNLSQFVCFSFSLPPVEILCVCVCVCVCVCRGVCMCEEGEYLFMWQCTQPALCRAEIIPQRREQRLNVRMKKLDWC